jgi:hypothetical protein
MHLLWKPKGDIMVQAVLPFFEEMTRVHDIGPPEVLVFPVMTVERARLRSSLGPWRETVHGSADCSGTARRRTLICDAGY